jgi:hypothetical protein
VSLFARHITQSFTSSQFSSLKTQLRHQLQLWIGPKKSLGKSQKKTLKVFSFASRRLELDTSYNEVDDEWMGKQASSISKLN